MNEENDLVAAHKSVEKLAAEARNRAEDRAWQAAAADLTLMADLASVIRIENLHGLANPQLTSLKNAMDASAAKLKALTSASAPATKGVETVGAAVAVALARPLLERARANAQVPLASEETKRRQFAIETTAAALAVASRASVALTITVTALCTASFSYIAYVCAQSSQQTVVGVGGALLFAVLCVMAWLSSASQKPLRRALAAQVMSSSEASDQLLKTIAEGR
jgi:hypothetical protein